MSKNKEKRQPIKVYVRVRPLNDSERCRGSHIIVECSPNTREVVVNERPGDKITRTFTFDKVFGPTLSQLEVYRCVASPLIQEVLDGYNCTIFAYGQTGAGKTYTMEGQVSSEPSMKWNHDSHAGIIPRTVGHLFDELRVLNVEFLVKVSFLEIYNEELFDLLSSDDDSIKLRIYEDAVKKGAIIVNGLEEMVVRNKDDVFTILEKGCKKRQTAATLMNASSSRSHTVFGITVQIRERVDKDEMVRIGKLNLVDLAGSENIGRSGAVEKRAREAGSINQSLLTLGRVITALVEKTPHVPYRESKLTRLLQESLGGRTKTCIIATISPSYCNLEETLSTLDYAHRAKNIQNKPEINQKIGKVELIQEYLEEIHKLKSDLSASRQKNGIYVAEENYNAMMLQIENQKRELASLLIDMKSVMDTLERKEEMNRELNRSLELYQLKVNEYQEELLKANNSLEESEVLLHHHIKTEEKLSNQAHSLLQVAETATRDVHVLHNTLDRKRNLEVNNVAACRNIATTLKRSLSSFSELNHELQDNYLKSNKELIGLIEKGQLIADSRTQKLKDGLDGAVCNSRILINKLQMASKELGSQNDAMLGTATSNVTQSYNLSVQTGLEFLEDIASKSQHISGKLSEFKMEYQSNAAAVLQKIEERDINLQNFLQSCTMYVSEARKDMESRERILVEKREAASEKRKRMEKKMIALEQKLKENYQQSINAFHQENVNLDSLLSTVKISSSNLENLTSETNRLKRVAEDSEANTCCLFKERSDEVAQRVERLRGLCSDINELIEEERSNFTANQKRCLSESVNHLNYFSSCVTEFDRDLQHKTEELENCFKMSMDGLKKDVENTHQLLSAVNQECRLHTAVERDITVPWSDCVQGNVSECIELVERLVVREVVQDVPSGNTPQRRDFIYPRLLAATSPHERILARHRGEKCDGKVQDKENSKTKLLISKPIKNDTKRQVLVEHNE